MRNSKMFPHAYFGVERNESIIEHLQDTIEFLTELLEQKNIITKQELIDYMEAQMLARRMKENG